MTHACCFPQPIRSSSAEISSTGESSQAAMGRWDQKFESLFLQGGVTNEPSVCLVDLEPRAERKRAKPGKREVVENSLTTVQSSYQ
jgi:hypothetical protein